MLKKVFFLRRKTSLLRHYILADTIVVCEPKVVSGIMTTIQNCVHKAFQEDAENTFEVPGRSEN